MAEGISDIRLASDPGFRDERKPADRQGRLRRSAIIAAALVHALVIGGIAVRWPALFPVVPPPQQAIPVTLVTLPPPPPPAPKVQQALQPPPPPPPALQHERVSGPDTETTAPPKQADKGVDAAPEPTAPPPVETPTKTAALTPAEEKPKPKPDVHPPKPKVALRETVVRPDRSFANRAPGETERSGDPYLNRLYDLIEAHRSYPANAVGSLGMKLAGTVVYLIGVRSDGALIGTKLQRSSGADVLDQTALRMIEAAAPFPPLPPSEFSGPEVVIQVTIYIAPAGG